VTLHYSAGSRASSRIKLENKAILGDNPPPGDNSPGDNPPIENTPPEIPPPRLGVLTLTDARRGVLTLTLTLTDPRGGKLSEN